MVCRIKQFIITKLKTKNRQCEGAWPFFFFLSFCLFFFNFFFYFIFFYLSSTLLLLSLFFWWDQDWTRSFMLRIELWRYFVLFLFFMSTWIWSDVPKSHFQSMQLLAEPCDELDTSIKVSLISFRKLRQEDSTLCIYLTLSHFFRQNRGIRHKWKALPISCKTFLTCLSWSGVQEINNFVWEIYMWLFFFALLTFI